MVSYEYLVESAQKLAESLCRKHSIALLKKSTQACEELISSIEVEQQEAARGIYMDAFNDTVKSIIGRHDE